MERKGKSVTVDGLSIEVTYKKVKRLNLRANPLNGQIRISAPPWISCQQIERFVRLHMDWLRRQLAREAENKPLSTWPVWGLPYALDISESARNRIEVQGQTLKLEIRGPATNQSTQTLLRLWQKEQVTIQGRVLLTDWAKRMNLEEPSFGVRLMSSRWGSCRPAKKAITLNSALASYRVEALEYVIVHELAHFYVHNHGPEFRAIMKAHLPDWKEREMLLRPER